MNHEKYIRQTFELAKKGIGKVSPNPLVGAVIVINNKIVATGYHKSSTSVHAEVDAINKFLKNNSHKLLKEATLYTNLEPCCHFGNNPPCVDIIASFNFKQVVYSNTDPNPLVKNKGKKALQDFGIKVNSGVLKEEGEELNKYFFKYVTENKPYIVLKTALSLDGKITHPRSKYLSNKESLQYVHELRNKVDAILIGYNTFKKDKPKLTCRLKNGINPKPIILTKNKTNLNKLIQSLAKDEITSLLVEGGSQVITSFLEEKLADEIILIYTPEIFGESELSYCKKLSKIVKLKSINIKKLGDNIVLQGYVK